jgi:hypothetical protein
VATQQVRKRSLKTLASFAVPLRGSLYAQLLCADKKLSLRCSQKAGCFCALLCALRAALLRAALLRAALRAEHAFSAVAGERDGDQAVRLLHGWRDAAMPHAAQTVR